jgi:hypothetical protein
MFKGEQHGFRGAPAIRAALEGELYFYGKVRGRACLVGGDAMHRRAQQLGVCMRARSRVVEVAGVNVAGGQLELQTNLNLSSLSQ